MLPTLLHLLAFLSGPAALPAQAEPAVATLSSHTMPLNDRYGNTFVNDVFKDNILLTLHYLDGSVKNAGEISWDNIEKPLHYEFNLNPGEEFAFHDAILPKYNKNVVKTTNAHFNYTDGFKSDGYLTGDGVCHLASLVYWVAKDAGLDSYAPANHDFATIADVPREYGVAIYVNPFEKTGARSNLYITNTKEKPVKFVFDYKDENLTVSVVE